MKTFVVTVDPGAWADPAGIIRSELERHFGPVQVASGAGAQASRAERRDRHIAAIVNRVSDAMRLPASAIVGESRCREYTRARFAVMWLAKLTSGRSTVVIGRALGDRDHSTVINGIRRARDLRRKDLAFRRVTSKVLRDILEQRQ